MKKAIFNNLLLIAASATLFGFDSGAHLNWLDKLVDTKKKLEIKLKEEPFVKNVSFGGGGSLGFSSFSVLIWYHSEVRSQEAKELVLSYAENILEEINSEKQLRPAMLTYPFTLSQVGITLVFYRDLHQFVEEGNVSYVYLSDGEFVVGFQHKKLGVEDSYKSPVHLYFQNNPEAKTKYPNVWTSLQDGR